MTEAYLLFYQAVLPTFICLNLLLQREGPCIFLVADAIKSYLQKLLAKFVTIHTIKSKPGIADVNCQCIDSQLDDNHITIGITTKGHLMKLFNDGSINDRNKKLFFDAVRAFYEESVTKALKKLPINDLVLNHAKFLNFEKRKNHTFDNVEYFCGSFHNLLNFTPVKTDKLQKEFIMYQLLDRYGIPDIIIMAESLSKGG